MSLQRARQSYMSKSPRALGPLRKIVGHERDERGLIRERLECGHLVSIRRDHYGETVAERRRCHQCRREEGLAI